MTTWLELLIFAGGITGGLALAELISRWIDRYTRGFWAREDLHRERRQAPREPRDHLALARPVMNGGDAWVSACTCGWTGDVYGTREFQEAARARAIALHEAIRHVQSSINQERI